MNRFLKTALAIVTLVTAPLYAAEMDHNTMHHGNEAAPQESQLQQPATDNKGKKSMDDARHHENPTSMNAEPHHDHYMPDTASGYVQPSGVAEPQKLQRLQKMPPSGKSREAYFDDTVFMNTLSPEHSLEEQCALASRGLIMLDNASWERCGGKPEGWSKGPAVKQAMDHSQHDKH